MLAPLYDLQQRIFVLWVTPLTSTTACPGTRGFNPKTLWPLERNNIPKLDSGLHHKHCWNPLQSNRSFLDLGRRHGTRLEHPQCQFCNGWRTEALSSFSSSSWHHTFHASKMRVEENNVTAPLKITLQCVQNMIGDARVKSTNNSSLRQAPASESSAHATKVWKAIPSKDLFTVSSWCLQFPRSTPVHA